jgi:Leucine-rich repeat (LRR) protein
VDSGTEFEPFKVAASHLQSVATVRGTHQPFEELIALIRAHFPGRVRRYDALAEQLSKLTPIGLKISPDHRRSAEVGKWLGEVRRGNAPDPCGSLLRWLWNYHPEEARQFHERWAVPAPVPDRENQSPVRPRRHIETDQIVLARIETEEREQTGALSLVGLNVPYLPDELARLPWLEDLDLTSTSLRSLAGLERLPQLRMLNVTDTRISSLSAPETARSIEVLLCLETNISDLSGLERFAGLKTLNADRNQMLRTLDGIESCSRLEHLSVASTPIRNVFALRTLTQLVEVNLDSTDIESLAGLEAHKALRVLALQRNRRLGSLVGLEGCT